MLLSHCLLLVPYKLISFFHVFLFPGTKGQTKAIWIVAQLHDNKFVFHVLGLEPNCYLNIIFMKKLITDSNTICQLVFRIKRICHLGADTWRCLSVNTKVCVCNGMLYFKLDITYSSTLYC